jgi:murein DD-endopeptidase MepM/ murein hydrolase activator NlpD
MNDHNDPLYNDEPLYNPEDTPVRGTPISAGGPKTPPSGLRRAANLPPKTNPSLKLRALTPPPPAPAREGGPLGLVMLALAALITLAAGFLYLQEGTPAPEASATVVAATSQPTTSIARVQPTEPAQVEAATATSLPTATDVPPTPMPLANLTDTTVPSDVLAELLQQPGFTAPPADAFFRMQNAYTIAPARSRSRIIQYVIQSGDTLDKIAERFGLSLDTLVWNNDGLYVNRLPVGGELTILPENGVLHKTSGEETIQSIADAYKVSVYAILDSEFNPQLQRAKASTLLTPGISLMVPGGISEKKPVYWNPGISFSNSDGSVASGSSGSGGGGAMVSFGGGPGSCGAQPNGGGTGSLVVPLPPVYNVVRGFSAYHTGIDLSAPTGTTVFAADGGTVIFAGWSNWGYGNSVVIAHGRLLTLYGHMSSVSVSCGQTVNQGTPIGAVGSTGNSSGPHLHFEVRIGESPDSPESYLVF